MPSSASGIVRRPLADVGAKATTYTEVAKDVGQTPFSGDASVRIA